MLISTHFLPQTGDAAQPSSSDGFQAWHAELARLQPEKERDKVEEINRYINRALSFSDDRTQWGLDDYWATPREAVAQRRGDCEDYAIAKYFSLRKLGVASDKLWLVHAKARIGAPDSNLTKEHIVLAYYPAPAADPLILDNLLTTLYPASARPDLTPVFRFNSENVHIDGVRYPTHILGNWQALLDKMESSRK